MAVWIDDYLIKDVKNFVKENYGNTKHVYAFCRKRSWQQSRYIQVTTPVKDREIHYEYYEGRVQLHFEDKYTYDKYRAFRDFLYEHTSEIPEIIWDSWQYDGKRCVLDCDIDSWDELHKAFHRLIDIFDPLIETYMEKHHDLFPCNEVLKVIPDLSYNIVETNVDMPPQIDTKSVGELPFDTLEIPAYQRPYKWTAPNVNQLISDLITFRDKKQYRLGTLVLHGNEIVDGQQRIITLILLITQMLETIEDEKIKNSYKDIINKLDSFINRVSFSNRYSLHNIVENIHTIKGRKNDFDQHLFEFLLNRCEFVVVQLNNISEAFQFFDSQNARGKDLEAHDLLKAYHLREIKSLSEADSMNIDEWQNKPTEFLKDVFLNLFRAKRWSKGKWARFFTKNHTDIFKGISLSDGKRYPFHQMEVIAHIFSELYNSDPTRIIDGKKLEYPFNLDDQIINGSRFFDMIRHYMTLYVEIKNLRNTLSNGSKAKEILNLIHKYDECGRTGDKYVRNMFYTLLLYYIDRFGNEELDKVIPQFFIWAYKLRLQHFAVQLASIDNYASDWESMFKRVSDAKTPYDIINFNINGVFPNNVQCSGCKDVKDAFKKLNKLYSDE